MKINPKASQRQLDASDPASTVWVNANAGSGKTHVLVDRVIRLLLRGVDPSRIMCLTFTKAAAAEMASRLFERLSHWITLDDDALVAALEVLGTRAPDAPLRERARQLFTRALETPGGLKIQTIHAFCERVLQLFPIEAGIVPHFTMLDDRSSNDLLQRARNTVLAQAQARQDGELGAALRDVAHRTQASDFDTLLAQVLKERASCHDVLEPLQGLNVADALLRHHLQLTGITADTIHRQLDIDPAQYRRLADALDTGSATDKERAAEIRRVLSLAAPTLIALKSYFMTGKDERRTVGGMVNTKVQDSNDWIDPFVTEEQRRLVHGLGRLADLDRLAATLSVLKVSSAIVTEFERVKRQRGSYDFDDLIIRTGELLRERPDAAWVLYKLDGGIEHLLVDEAQDTSPAQWQIIRSLTDEFFAGEGRHGRKPRTVFVVGDRKQSIYSFQGADPDVFGIVHDDFKTRAEDAGGGLRDVDLTVSFRSTPQVLQAVDLVFEPHSEARRGLDGRIPRDWLHESNRSHAQGIVEIWPLVEPLEEPQRDTWQAPVDREPAQSPRRRLARQLAQTIKGWIGARIMPALQRPVRPEDILILVRSRNSFFDAMIRALWNEQVPVAGADRLKLGENIAVLDLVALAQFCIMPEDDHALACILKSPIMASPLGEDDLIEIAARRGTKPLWESLRHTDGPVFSAAAAQLALWLSEARISRPFEFLSAVLAEARARFLARLGSEANDAIDALLDMALDYEEDHDSSLAGFVNWFASGDIEIKRNMEQGTGEVRIMTVHGAKGLEAPIVILPDTISVPDHRTTDPLMMLEAGNGNAKVPLWPVPKLFNSEIIQSLKASRQDMQTDEYRRLLYVAMTRARDELYVCGYTGTRDPSPHCWYNVISGSLTAHMTEIGDDKGWRLGPVPVYKTTVVTESLRLPKEHLPGWISAPIRSVPAKIAGKATSARRSERVARGILVHRILQQLPDLPETARSAFIGQAVARADHATSLAKELEVLIHHPAFAELFDPEGLSEVPLMIDVPGEGPQRRRIDRLVMTETGILAADYKTDRHWPADVTGVNPEYLVQMATYRDALRKIHPGAPLRMALLWTEAPALMVLPDEVMTQALIRTPISFP